MNVKTMRDLRGMADEKAQAAQAQFAKDGREALARLVKIATDGYSGQAAPMGNSLLARWNADRDGGFDFTHRSNIDESLASNMMTVTAFLAMTRSYQDSYGHQEKMEKLVGLYSQKKRRRAR